MKSIQNHNSDVKKIQDQISRADSSKKIRFNKGGTNSTRKNNEDYNFVDISQLNEIIKIDKKRKEALVEPNVPMDKLLKATIEHGLIPAVIPEFPGITVGGAIQGAALESSSFRFGQFNDSCLEYEIVNGKGKKMKASPKINEDLFYGISGSYGSLGLLTLIKLKLVKASKFVKIRIVKFSDVNKAIGFIKKASESKLDFVEGIIFNKERIAIILGEKTNKATGKIVKFSGRFDDWFYQHVNRTLDNENKEIYVPILDYIFRYDRGAFWMGEYPFIMKIPGGNNKLSRALFNSFLKTRELYRGLHLANLSQRFFIQDIYFPLSESEKYLKFVQDELDILPIWLCPIKATSKNQRLSPHYNKDKLLLNIGVWGQSKLFLKDYYKANRKAEIITMNLGGRKMLYAQQYYPLKEFWNIYDKNWYLKLRKKYAAEVFPDVYERTFVSERYTPTPISGFFKFHFSRK